MIFWYIESNMSANVLFLKVMKCLENLAFYLFTPTRLINSMKK